MKSTFFKENTACFMKPAHKKIILILTVMVLALCTLIGIITYSRDIAKTHSAATEYTPHTTP